MSNGFSSPYSDYQQASCQWLDSIPQHWIECRIKQIVSTPVTDGPHETPKFEDDGVPFLSAESVKDLKLDFARKRGFISRTLHEQYSRKYVPERGDIYMVKSGATTGALAIVETDEEFNIWSPLAAIRCRKDLCFDRFVFYAMQSEFFQRSVELSWSFGTQQNIGMGVIENLFIARPPVTEQKQIASFLDYETAKIDALIEKQQQLIALLGEKRQAVISHAVTKGLNPDAPMRDSGVEWLGQVPEHWTVCKCGFYLSVLSGFAFPSSGFSDDENDTRLLRGINVSVSSIRWYETVRWKRRTGDRLDEYEMAVGDLVIGMDRPIISEGIRVAKITEADVPSLLLQRVASIKPGPKLNSDFLMQIMSSPMFAAHIEPETTGVSVPHISPTQIADFVIAMPPVEEQTRIANVLHERLAKFDSLEANAEDAVELLQERRTALISAAVTGKIDVRGWKPPSSAAKSETEMEVA